MKIVEEFKQFIMRGNVVDMAVGVIIGGAFGKIVSSLVSDVIMPPIGLLLGKVDFSSLYLDMSGKGYASFAEAKAAGAPTLNYGLFLNNVINFLIIAFVIFIIIKQINKLQGPVKSAVPTTKECPFCCSTVPIKAIRCPHCISQF